MSFAAKSCVCSLVVAFFGLLAFAQTPFPCKISTANRNCLTIGPLAPQNQQGWIVGEIKTFAVGADSQDLIAQLAERGWVEAAGQSAIRKDFDELWKIMGTDWGSADKTNVFFLPDLRGLFLRSWDHGRTVPQGHEEPPYTGDPGDLTQTRVAPRPEIPATVGSVGAVGDHVGSMQADQFQTHQHGLGGFSYGKIKAECGNGCGALIAVGASNTISVSGRNGADTHPSNAYIMYFIYVGKPAKVIEPTTEETKDPAKRTGRIECIKDSGGRCRAKVEIED